MSEQNTFVASDETVGRNRKPNRKEPKHGWGVCMWCMCGVYVARVWVAYLFVCMWCMCGVYVWYVCGVYM